MPSPDVIAWLDQQCSAIATADEAEPDSTEEHELRLKIAAELRKAFPELDPRTLGAVVLFVIAVQRSVARRPGLDHPRALGGMALSAYDLTRGL